ncbi:general stress protein [Streptomyces spiralis]|uniref:general stress protein n=1 Tax=Streptomyces spiralis TaxID=66376 RepID=UPI003408C16E
MTEQQRRPVAYYKAYREAEHTVDHLSDHGFPVEAVAITGQDVRMVEQVIGRVDHDRAAGERCALRCPDRLAVRPCELARTRPVRPAPRPVRADLRSNRRRAVRHAAAGPAGQSSGLRLAPLDAAEPVRGRGGRGGHR